MPLIIVGIPPSILSLPNELSVQVLQNLGLQALLACRQVLEHTKSTHVYKWADWAYDAINTTVIEEKVLDHGSVCGMRTIGTGNMLHSSVVIHLEIDDFHPYRLEAYPFGDVRRVEQGPLEAVWGGRGKYLKDYWCQLRRLSFVTAKLEMPDDLRGTEAQFLLSDDTVIVLVWVRGLFSDEGRG
ncbi:hypothetical protein FA95DRAFT_1606410 [Auriscalpium vulgare]|uniref:Uncharacterized protein n=1 Tax=Auriscalpium vulgare TaxID=40419 RepID=A0ACB8RSB1_9AGAM|nr:hypothetical protein FA95DRAFT_1606410 [Auriscalpium vulgare]